MRSNMKSRRKSRITFISSALLASMLFPILGSFVAAASITLDEAFDIALGRSSRGEIIRGSEEVAEQQYFAERIGFLLPKVSLNGEAPAYSNVENFRQFGNLPSKQLVGTESLDLRSNIQLKQSLLTGGDLTVTANLTRNDETYPTWDAVNRRLLDIGQLTNQGFFDFSFTQPLLQPSQAKHDLHNSRDDLELAQLARLEESATLKKDVAEAYLGLMELAIQQLLTADKFEIARLKAEIDSAKFVDQIVAEEDWLGSASAMIDAELEKFDTDNQYADKRRVLASLLDIDRPEEVETVEPGVPEGPTEEARQELANRWEESVPLRKASFQFSKEKRAADFSASSHGLTGDLRANYSLGRGTVETDGSSEQDNIKTNSWGVSVNLTFPIWDGGASAAAVKAARMNAEKARLELESSRKSAKAEVDLLLNSVDVSYRKLQVLRKQIEMAEDRLSIAKFRHEDGQISQIDFLDVRVAYLESRRKFMEELKKYYASRIDLEYRFSD